MTQANAMIEKVQSGKYSSVTNANRALGQIKLSNQDRARVRQAIAEKFGGKKATNGKKHKNGADPNGAGESRLTTLIKIMQSQSRANVIRLVAKSIDEGKTLPELHDELTELNAIIIK